ncbi:MAG: stage IV sporulation protein A [Firmicutes bacterium]|nr:stage IV sporulation protein A [Bacillota bacterium]
MINTNVYDEIGKRSRGDIYIGVVGPVRTGKSTFIKRFMDVMVFPNMQNKYEKTRVMDELPQSGEGRTITTMEPKFIPPEAVSIKTKKGTSCNVRLVDCVGYMIPGVLGNMEDGRERMVQTPWNREQIPFSEAATIGTEKVIKEHSVIGVVITTDGSFGELPRENFIEAERKTVNQLKKLEKPFVIILNSATPQNIKSRELAESLEKEYGVPVLVYNCQRMNEDNFEELFGKIILQFPAIEIHIKLPSYLEALDNDHWIKSTILEKVFVWMKEFTTIGQVLSSCNSIADGNIVKAVRVISSDISCGKVILEPLLDSTLYYKVIEELLDSKVENDKQLFVLLKEYAAAKNSYDSVKGALFEVEKTDYGIVAPKLSEMTLEKPEVFKQGNKYGVRIKASAPCLHIIKTDITTEVSPLVGTESQSIDLAKLLMEQYNKADEALWETNLFGKTLREMVTEQMTSKVQDVPEVLRGKVQKSLQKISDDGKDYFICIII